MADPTSTSKLLKVESRLAQVEDRLDVLAQRLLKELNIWRLTALFFAAVICLSLLRESRV